MCNCNQKRVTYTSQHTNAEKGMVKVTLIENKPIVVNGDITGRMYVFRHINDFNWVDKRDALSITHYKQLQVLQ